MAAATVVTTVVTTIMDVLQGCANRNMDSVALARITVVPVMEVTMAVTTVVTTVVTTIMDVPKGCVNRNSDSVVRDRIIVVLATEVIMVETMVATMVVVAQVSVRTTVDVHYCCSCILKERFVQAKMQAAQQVNLLS